MPRDSRSNAVRSTLIGKIVQAAARRAVTKFVKQYRCAFCSRKPRPKQAKFRECIRFLSFGTRYHPHLIAGTEGDYRHGFGKRRAAECTHVRALVQVVGIAGSSRFGCGGAVFGLVAPGGLRHRASARPARRQRFVGDAPVETLARQRSGGRYGSSLSSSRLPVLGDTTVAQRQGLQGPRPPGFCPAPIAQVRMRV